MKKKGEIFPIKKAEFSGEKGLEILEKYIVPLYSKGNKIRFNSNGVGPSPIDSKAVRRILK